MKQILQHTIVILLLSFQSVAFGQTNNFPQALIRATQNGDASTLAGYFNDNIELVLPGKSGVYSRNQAEMVVRDFFASADPQEFKIIHEGNRENASFVIGSLTGKSETYRIYFLTKNNDKKLVIHQLRIEKQDD
ncbi:MAG: DUF4783 domain-containing protein [Breznakibacter sp.]|nr:DUF4783 domain-containing protein [Breznakibacter sp.]